VDHPPQQCDILKEGKLDLSSGKDKIEIVGDQPEMIYVAVEPYANLASETPPPEQNSAGAAPVFIGGNTDRNNGLYALGPPSHPADLASRRRGLQTSMHSGMRNSLPRPGFRSTRS